MKHLDDVRDGDDCAGEYQVRDCPGYIVTVNNLGCYRVEGGRFVEHGWLNSAADAHRLAERLRVCR